MFIPVSEVKDWKYLQKKVCIFFSELGYTAFTEHKISLYNDAITEVDVFAQKGSSPLAQIILIECKYWNSDVPRAIVQSFKMDVQEAGANFGIIVSKSGFQSGAYKGVNLSTVKLYTFEELQKAFSKEWAEVNLTPITHMYNILVDKMRAFQYGTFEKEYFQKTLFNDRLKALEDNLEFSTLLALSLYKDYFTKNPLDKVPKINYTIPYYNKVISFDSIRTMKQELKRLMTEAFDNWNNYRNIFEEEIRRNPEYLKEIFMIK